MMIAIASTVMGPAFPFIMQEFAIPLTMLGFLASAWNVGYLFTPIGGIISDRYGEPIVLAISFVTITSAVGLVLKAPNYLTLAGLFLADVEKGLGAIVSRSVLIARTRVFRNRFRELYDSSTMSFIAKGLCAREVSKMPVPIGLLFIGMLIRTILGAVLVAALVFLFWKIGRLADTYVDKIKMK